MYVSLVSVFEVLIVVLLTYFFYNKFKPKLIYLIYGYAFFIFSLFLQLPLRIAEFHLSGKIDFIFLSALFITIITVLISEFTKYFSMKRSISTRSAKNALFFGIGWVSLESLSFFTKWFYETLFALLSLNLNVQDFLPIKLAFFNFIFFLVVNLGITVLIILSIIKKRNIFLFSGLLFAVMLNFGLYSLSGDSRIGFMLLSFAFSLYLIFYFWRNWR